MTFISFEGMEGAGKTTQIKCLQKALIKAGFEVLTTREPGGTAFGKTIRNLLLKNDSQIENPYTDLCLFTADRLEHIEKVIKPALAKNQIVICDRFTDSTIAYQVGGQGLAQEKVMQFVNLSDIKPDLTVFLDLDPASGLNRVFKRQIVDRYEQKEIAFHLRVRSKYYELAALEPFRFFKINTEESSLNNTKKQILDKVLQILEPIKAL